MKNLKILRDRTYLLSAHDLFIDHKNINILLNKNDRKSDAKLQCISINIHSLRICISFERYNCSNSLKTKLTTLTNYAH